jgi:hypothetical protein
MVRLQLVLQLIFWCVGLPLTMAVIVAMAWRGHYRRYPVLFLYTITSLALTIWGMPSYVAFYFYRDPGARARMGEWSYYDDLVIEPLAYAVVISMIYIAASHLRARRPVLTATIGGAILFAGGSLLFHYRPSGEHGVWMTLWTRDINFASEILDLGLWALLLSTKGRDTRLLLVTGGLGIQFTGDAIGDSIRSIAVRWHSRPVAYFGSFFSTVADLTALYVFWQAFRKKDEPQKNARSQNAH